MTQCQIVQMTAGIHPVGTAFMVRCQTHGVDLYIGGPRPVIEFARWVQCPAGAAREEAERVARFNAGNEDTEATV